jgi:hypothetical protein
VIRSTVTVLWLVTQTAVPGGGRGSMRTSYVAPGGAPLLGTSGAVLHRVASCQKPEVGEIQRAGVAARDNAGHSANRSATVRRMAAPGMIPFLWQKCGGLM